MIASGFSNGGFEGLDDGWDSIEPAAPSVPTNDRYLARLASLLPFERVGVAPKLRLVFRIVRGSFKGCETTYFLSFGNRARAKETLALLSLGNVPPSELLAFTDFDRLPSVYVTTVRTESNGRIYANVALIEPVPMRLESGDKSPPDPSSAAA